MLSRGRALLATLCISSSALGAATGLTPADLAHAQRIDALTIPTPGELFAAVNKQGKPNWQAKYRPPISTSYTSRAQIALNLGGLIADGFIGVEAADGQQVKNIGKDILALARPLGVSEKILGRGNSITEFADNNEWSTLKEELEATQNEVKQAMDEQGDRELVVLVSLGGWIRGTEVISSWISDNYTAEGAKLLRQPALIQFMRKKVAELPEKTQDDPSVRAVKRKLETIEKLVSFPMQQVPTEEEVKNLRTAASEMVAIISEKK